MSSAERRFRAVLVLSLAFLFWLTVPIAITAQESTEKGFFTGNGFQTMTEAEQIGYVAGVLDTASIVGQGLNDVLKRQSGGARFSFIGIIGSDSALAGSFSWFTCLNKGRYAVGFSTTQALAIVKKYLGDHPQEWNEGASRLVLDALFEACK